MLTKEERAAIAARLISYDGGTLYFAELFECLFNREIPGSTTTKEDTEAVIDRLIDLCDTSNMIELPLDKDGEVIRAGDTVYIGDGIKYEVAGYMMRGNGTEVILAAGAEPVYTKEPANNITHKKPVTIASLVSDIKRVIDKGEMTSWSMVKLFDIAEQLEKLGDSDAN